MKAVVVHGAKDLRVDDRPAPRTAAGQALVRIEWGGICGSDLSYFLKAAAGTNTLTQPLVLGHEIAGRIVEIADSEAGDLKVGDPVAVHPARPIVCDDHPVRADGRNNLHPIVEHLGSAALTPHTDGGFCELLSSPLSQLRRLPEGVSTRRGAVAEPLGVALHAVRRAGDIAGKTVLVNGCGPIGSLVVAVAKALGAATVIASDLQATALRIAERMGADLLVNLRESSLPQDVDVSFEASGAGAAIGPVLLATVRGGVVVQVGNLPTTPIEAALGQLVTREIDYRGSYRFVDEITDAIELLRDGFDVDPILTHEFGIDDALQAFQTAADRSTGSSKVLLKLA